MLGPTHVNVTVHRAFNLNTKGKAVYNKKIVMDGRLGRKRHNKLSTNDAYVVIQLGNDTYKTSVTERTTTPVWNEEYMFPLPLQSRNSDVIRVSVFHRNLLSLDDLLGVTELPLYKIRDWERARIRRYALHDKLPSRVSFGKGGKSGRRKSDVLEPSCTDGGLTPVTPVTPELGQGSIDESGSQRPEIELTITFTQDKSGVNNHNLLRPRSSNELSKDVKDARRRSMPISYSSNSVSEETSSEVKKKNRHSIMTVFEMPKNLLNSTLRRSSARSIEDVCPANTTDTNTIRKEPAQDLTYNASNVVLRNNNKATNNSRPNKIMFSMESPSQNEAGTAWRPISLIMNTPDRTSSLYMTSPESALTPDSYQSSTEVETEGEERDDELYKYLKERKKMIKATKKLPGFMTIDSQEKISKYQPTNEEKNLFGGYNREDLISTVIRQHARLAVAEAYIGDLEHCINNLVLRAMEAQPRLLQNPYLRQDSEPATSSSRRPAFLKVTKKVKAKLNRR